MLIVLMRPFVVLVCSLCDFNSRVGYCPSFCTLRAV